MIVGAGVTVDAAEGVTPSVTAISVTDIVVVVVTTTMTSGIADDTAGTADCPSSRSSPASLVQATPPLVTQGGVISRGRAAAMLICVPVGVLVAVGVCCAMGMVGTAVALAGSSEVVAMAAGMTTSAATRSAVTSVGDVKATAWANCSVGVGAMMISVVGALVLVAGTVGEGGSATVDDGEGLAGCCACAEAAFASISVEVVWIARTGAKIPSRRVG